MVVDAKVLRAIHSVLREGRALDWCCTGWGEAMGAYMRPSDHAVLSHDGPDELRMFFRHIFDVFLLAEPRLAVTTDGETI